MALDQRRLGVVLFQLGGPENLDAIEPFLYNLFCDPEIIDFPCARLGRRALAKLISTSRARKVRHHYEAIGGGSPIRKTTERQAQALEAELSRMGVNARCFVAMRYWHPFTAEAVAAVKAVECTDLVLLPLYPQYSSTTTGSSLNEWARHFSPNGTRIHVVRDFYQDETYLDALVAAINGTLARFPVPSEPELIFSAHSVPLAVIEKGDPYQMQIEETVKLATRRGGWPNKHRLCYQSKLGAGKWLQPSLRTTLRSMAAEAVRRVCVVPISFVSDHLETLGEIDQEARGLAASLGMSQFEVVPGLNDIPKFIAALAQIVLRCIREQEGVEHSFGVRLSSPSNRPVNRAEVDPVRNG